MFFKVINTLIIYVEVETYSWEIFKKMIYKGLLPKCTF